MPTLEFKGKQHIYAHHLTVPYRPLVPDADRSAGPGAADPGSGTAADDNLIIHGDNLHALKALLPRYAGRVKCVYIDPPYNTGNEGWIYNDKVNSPLMKAWLKENSPVDGEDLERHDKWLCMMWPRLHLLKELLADDGAIFISIDDTEVGNLRLILDEIFGEANFVATFSRVRTETPAGLSRKTKTVCEFVLCYEKVKNSRKFRGIPKVSPSANTLMNQSNAVGILSFPASTPTGLKDGIYEKGKYGTKRYPINLIETVKVTNGKFDRPLKLSGRFRWSQAYLDRQLSSGVRVRIATKNFQPSYEKDEYEVEAPPNLLNFEVGIATNEQATTELEEIIGQNTLDYPKPMSLVSYLVNAVCDDTAIVLDSFAGSGTTAHAVLALNKADDGNRKFILVECEAYADNITAERIRRVIKGVPKAKDATLRESLGGSFTYCTLGEPLDAEAMLTGANLPDRSTLAAWLLHTATGVSAGPADLESQNDDGLFHSEGSTDYYLLYRPDLEWLHGHDAMFNEERAKRIAAVNREKGREAVVFAPGKYITQRDLTAMGITFCQLPYDVHRPG